MIALMHEEPVRYRDEDHTYWFGTRRALSVTQAIHEGGLTSEFAQSFWSPSASSRGTDLHDALWYHCTTKRTPVLIDEYEGYWASLMAFLESSEIEILDMERVIGDVGLGYAGRYDIVGRLKKYAELPGLDLIDVKTGVVPVTVGAQTMAYRMQLRERVVRRWALQVTETGYKLLPLNLRDIAAGTVDRIQDIRDEALFRSALTVAQFRREHYRG